MQYSLTRNFFNVVLGCYFAAAFKPSIPLIPRNIFASSNRWSPQLSPDGNFLAYLAPLNGISNVFVQMLNQHGKTTEKLVTFDILNGIHTFSWTHLPGTLMYNQDGDVHDHRLYRVDVISGLTQLLTLTTSGSVEITASNWKFPQTVYIEINDRDPRHFDLYQLNLVTAHKTLIVKNTVGFRSFIFDNSFQLRLASKEAEDGGTNYFIPRAHGKFIQWHLYKHVKFEDDFITNVGGFDATNNKTYWITSEHSDLASLTIEEFDEPSRYHIIYSGQRSDVHSVLFHPTLHKPLVLYEDYKRRKRIHLDYSIRQDFEYLDRMDPNGEVLVLSVTNDFTKWLVAVVFDNQSTKYYIYERNNRNAVFLFKGTDDLDSYKLAKSHAVEIPTRDGLIQVCYLSLPVELDPQGTGNPFKPVPLIMLVHGGPHTIRHHWEYVPQVLLFANRGYAVLRCNFRGSSGYGKYFANLGNGEWGRKMLEDLIDGAKWAIDQKIADPKKIAIYGASYGGYAALAALTFKPDFFACAVDICGPSNLITMINNVPPHWEPYQRSEIRRIGGDPKTTDGRKFLRSQSPLFYAHMIKKPLLIAQGSLDAVIDKSESDQIFEVMKRNKIPVTYLLFPNEGHGFVRPENINAFYMKAEQFLAQCLGGRFEGTNGGSPTASSMLVLHEGGFEHT